MSGCGRARSGQSLEFTGSSAFGTLLATRDRACETARLSDGRTAGGRASGWPRRWRRWRAASAGPCLRWLLLRSTGWLARDRCRSRRPAKTSSSAVEPDGAGRHLDLEAHIQIFYSGPAAQFSWILPVDAAPGRSTPAATRSSPSSSGTTTPSFQLTYTDEGTCRPAIYPPGTAAAAGARRAPVAPACRSRRRQRRDGRLSGRLSAPTTPP